MARCHPLRRGNTRHAGRDAGRGGGLQPRLWLVSDARNDAALERAIARLPRGSGLIFRHYHLTPASRRRRFAVLARAIRARGGVAVLAGQAALARRWGADGVYGGSDALRRVDGLLGGLLRLATVHDLGELASACRAGVDAVLISPVFATRSHPGGAALGPVRALLLARRARMPAILLGGLTRRRARTLPKRLLTGGWAAIDGLSPAEKPRPGSRAICALS